MPEIACARVFSLPLCLENVWSDDASPLLLPDTARKRGRQPPPPPPTWAESERGPSVSPPSKVWTLPWAAATRVTPALFSPPPGAGVQHMSVTTLAIPSSPLCSARCPELALGARLVRDAMLLSLSSASRPRAGPLGPLVTVEEPVSTTRDIFSLRALIHLRLSAAIAETPVGKGPHSVLQTPANGRLAVPHTPAVRSESGPPPPDSPSSCNAPLR